VGIDRLWSLVKEGTKVEVEADCHPFFLGSSGEDGEERKNLKIKR
jgi:ribosomal protein L31